MELTQEKKNHLTLAKAIASLIITILLWSVVTNAWGYTKLLFNAQEGSWTVYIYNFCSRFIWALFAIVLLRIYKSDIPTTFSGLFTNKPHVRPLLISVAIIVIYNCGAMFVNHGEFWINPDFSFPKHFLMFIMVAFAEEIVYRGWGLNALSAFLSEKTANVVSTIFFILLHLPAYFIRVLLGDTFPVATVVTQCAFVLVLGVLFGYLYRKGKSLWSPMIVHFLTDFLSVLLIG